MKTKVLFLIAIIGLVIFSCQKELENIPLDDSSTLNFRTEVDMNHAKTQIAQLVAKAQKRSAVKSFLKLNAERDFAGEDAVLIAQVANETVVGNKTFKQVLLDEASNMGLTGFTNNYFESVLQSTPHLSIKFYTGSSDEDITVFNYNQNIEVVAIPDNYYNQEEVFASAWNSNLNPSVYSNKVEPTDPLLLIIEHPGVIAMDLTTQRPMAGGTVPELLTVDPCDDLDDAIQGVYDELNVFELPEPSDPNFVVLIQEYNALLFNLTALLEIFNTECSDPSSDPPTGGTDPSCERDETDGHERFHKIQILDANFNQICVWFQNTCRIQIVHVIMANPATPTLATPLKKFYNKKKKYLKNENWQYVGLDFYKWEVPETHANPSKWILIGKHKFEGAEVTHNFKLTAAFTIDEINFGTELGGSFKIKLTDFDAGEDVVYYCDPSHGNGTQYNTGEIRFHIKEH